MKTASKYLIVFLLVTIPSLSFKGNQQAITELMSSSYIYEKNGEMQITEFYYAKTLCYKYTTSVFRYKPIIINEKLIKSDFIYKEKLNELTETVKRILRKRKNQ